MPSPTNKNTENETSNNSDVESDVEMRDMSDSTRKSDRVSRNLKRSYDEIEPNSEEAKLRVFDDSDSDFENEAEFKQQKNKKFVVDYSDSDLSDQESKKKKISAKLTSKTGTPEPKTKGAPNPFFKPDSASVKPSTSTASAKEFAPIFNKKNSGLPNDVPEKN